MSSTLAGDEGAQVVVLGERLDLAGAQRLKTELIEKQGHDLGLDAAALTHIGAPGLQVLRAAARSWRDSGHVLSLENVSQDTADQLSLFGFSPKNVTQWEKHA